MEEPYCTCIRGRLDGFGLSENGEWVHSGCGKLAKMVYEKQLVEKIIKENEIQPKTD